MTFTTPSITESQLHSVHAQLDSHLEREAEITLVVPRVSTWRLVVAYVRAWWRSAQ